MMDGDDRPTGGKCPVMHGAMTTSAQEVTHWWPKTLNLDILHQHDTKVSPLGDFDYREAVKGLDFEAVKADVKALMTEVATDVYQFQLFDPERIADLRNLLEQGGAMVERVAIETASLLG